ncbi:MAG: transcription termination factor NusA [Pseudomonadales bacterium]|jgi:N utilization substance protein A|nr:transcription termination factor NusA [Pseudomonadales bacterium]
MASKKAQPTKTARSEFSAAITQIATERKISPESIYDAIRAALVSAYRKQAGGEEELIDDTFHYYATVDEVSGQMSVFRAPLTNYGEEDVEPEWDASKSEDVTPAGFGRIAAQTAKQVIIQRIHESEKEQMIADYADKIGSVITAQVLRMEGRNVLMDIGRGHGYMPPTEQMRGEFYKSNARLSVYIKEIGEVNNNKAIIVSRAAPELVLGLFEREVPEVAAGTVQTKFIAREAGVRTKVVVFSDVPGVDPVGSCVGQRGVRVQEIIKELNNERIDIIPFDEDFKTLIAAALAPAENLVIELDESGKDVTVIAPEDQVSLVIGRGGQNVRLAAKLLGVRITVQNSAGELQGKSTGEEEYEIDSFGLDTDTREELINNKLTTSADIWRFKEKIENNDKITPAQKKLIFSKVEEEDKSIFAK